MNIVIHGSTAVRGRGDLVAYRWALWKLTAPWTHRTRPGQGHAKAQTRLGVMYDTGKGVAQDDVEAVAWYRQAAEQGIAEAQYWLGYILARSAGNGGVPEDDAEAVRWYRRAAEQGLAGAQFNLGQMYELGRRRHTG